MLFERGNFGPCLRSTGHSECRELLGTPDSSSDQSVERISLHGPAVSRSGEWLPAFQTHDSSPTLVGIAALRDLNKLLSEPAQDATSIDTTDLESHQMPAARSMFFHKPVAMLLTLHPPYDAPTPMAGGDGQGYRFGSVFGDPVIVVVLAIVWL